METMSSEMPVPLVRLSWTHWRIVTCGSGEAPILMVAVSPETVMPLVSTPETSTAPVGAAVAAA